MHERRTKEKGGRKRLVNEKEEMEDEGKEEKEEKEVTDSLVTHYEVTCFIGLLCSITTYYQ